MKVAVPAWEKGGNTTWLACPACTRWFPVAASMLAADAPPCRCPACGREFRINDGKPETGGEQ